MSRRDQIRMTDDEVDEFLQGRHTLNVATYNHDGTIHLVAMWYGFVDGDIAFETFAKSQKVQNLRRDSRITVLVEDGDQYENLRGVEMVGTAEIVEDHETIMEVARGVLTRYHDIPAADLFVLPSRYAEPNAASLGRRQMFVTASFFSSGFFLGVAYAA